MGSFAVGAGTGNYCNIYNAIILAFNSAIVYMYERNIY